MQFERNQRLDFEAINRAALGSAESICRRLLPRGKRSGNWWSAHSPIREDRNPSFAVSLTTGAWRDFATGDRGSDLISLIAFVERLCQYEAGLRLASEVGIGLPRKNPEGLGDKDGDSCAARNSERALQCWRESKPGGLVPIYLAARGITIPVPPSLRFHPALKHAPSGMTLPAMVAAVQGPDRRITAVHRTYLNPEGTAKAGVERAKAMLGPCSGAAVRLGPAAEEVHIAEGIETALAAMQATGAPTWAALSTSGLRSLMLPPEIRTVVILADGDAPGLAAAESAAMRWSGEGRRVRIAKPPAGQDMADLLLKGAA